MLGKIISTWRNFLFSPPCFEAISIFRCALGLIIFLKYLAQLYTYRLRFTTHGFIDVGVLHWPLTEALIPWVYTSILIGAFAMIVGVGGRFAVLVCFLSTRYLYACNIFAVGGVETLLSPWLFYLFLCDSSRHLVFFPKKHLSQKKESGLSWINEDLSGLGVRLFQIQICIIYFFAFKSKLFDPSWQTGQAVWYLVQNPRWVDGHFSFLSRFPMMTSGMSWAVLLFEGYFPVLVWLPKVKRSILWIGIAFHSFIFFAMGLHFFATGMVLAYIFFLDSKIVKAGLVSSFRFARGPRKNLNPEF